MWLIDLFLLLRAVLRPDFEVVVRSRRQGILQVRCHLNSDVCAMPMMVCKQHRLLIVNRERLRW